MEEDLAMSEPASGTSKGICAHCGKDVFEAYPWFTCNPEKSGAKPVHDGCFEVFDLSEYKDAPIDLYAIIESKQTMKELVSQKKRIQRHLGLRADGVFGSATLSKIEDALGVPLTMPDVNMSAPSSFQWHLNAAGVKYFTEKEMFFKGASHASNGLNTDPPKSLWANGVKVAKVADELRHRCGFQMRVLSAYRSPAYNSRIGGAKYSRHKQFDAMDIKPASGAWKDLQTMKRVIREMRNEGKFRGGIGGYSSFLHIDVRGSNATWGK